jgi:hypothetical protein
MAAEWERYCGRGDLELEDQGVRVTLPGGRVHRLAIIDELDAYRLVAVAVRASALTGIESLPVRIWERNRNTELVGFKIGARNRLIGEAWVPKAGLTAAEFQEYVHAVAAECDRLEYQLTGSDAQ